MAASQGGYLLLYNKKKEIIIDVAFYLVLSYDRNGIRFEQDTTQTVISGQLKTMPAFIDVSAGRRCYMNKMTACLN